MGCRDRSRARWPDGKAGGDRLAHRLPLLGPGWLHHRQLDRSRRRTAPLGVLSTSAASQQEGTGMKWGIVFASTSFPQPDRAAALAQAAEEAGFESLWCPEHVVVAIGDNVTPYRASPDGKMDRLWRRGGIPDPLVWLTFVAARTTTINLGTNVVILPEHQPAVFAKSAATLDSLSGGRLNLGIGVGELPEEYAAVGMSFTNRGRRMDESIEAMRALWSQEVASYHGQHVRFDSVRCDPSPVRGTIPLHIGGASGAALRRAAKYGDGYFPFVGPELD